MNFDLTIWLGITLLLSMCVNAFLFWYLRNIVKKLLFVSENLSDLVEIVKNYEKHLKEIYKLEMFYGDTTLEFLMAHTRSLLEILKDYEDVYSIAYPIESQGEPDFDNEETTTDPTEEESPTEVNQKDVLYAGPRRRNN